MSTSARETAPKKGLFGRTKKPKDPNKVTRTKRRVDADGTKERLSVKSGEPIPRPRSR